MSSARPWRPRTRIGISKRRVNSAFASIAQNPAVSRGFFVNRVSVAGLYLCSASFPDFIYRIYAIHVSGKVPQDALPTLMNTENAQ